MGGGVDGVANIDYYFNEHRVRRKTKQKGMKSQESNEQYIDFQEKY